MKKEQHKPFWEFLRDLALEYSKQHNIQIEDSSVNLSNIR